MFFGDDLEGGPHEGFLPHRAQEHASKNGVTAPAATATACAKAAKARLAGALKRVADECRERAENVAGGLVEVLERLRIGVEEVAVRGGRVDIGGVRREGWESVLGGHAPQHGVALWERGSGESWAGGGFRVSGAGETEEWVLTSGA